MQQFILNVAVIPKTKGHAVSKHKHAVLTQVPPSTKNKSVNHRVLVTGKMLLFL